MIDISTKPPRFRSLLSFIRALFAEVFHPDVTTHLSLPVPAPTGLSISFSGLEKITKEKRISYVVSRPRARSTTGQALRPPSPAYEGVAHAPPPPTLTRGWVISPQRSTGDERLPTRLPCLGPADPPHERPPIRPSRMDRWRISWRQPPADAISPLWEGAQKMHHNRPFGRGGVGVWIEGVTSLFLELNWRPSWIFGDGPARLGVANGKIRDSPRRRDPS